MHVSVAQLSNRASVTCHSPRLRGIFTASDLCKLNLGLAPSLLDSQSSILADRIAPSPTAAGPVLDEERPCAGGFDSDTETAQFSTPAKYIASGIRFKGIDASLGESGHLTAPSGEAGGKQKRVSMQTLANLRQSPNGHNQLSLLYYPYMGNLKTDGKNGGLVSPKAEVTGSNPVGCATRRLLSASIVRVPLRDRMSGAMWHPAWRHQALIALLMPAEYGRP